LQAHPPHWVRLFFGDRPSNVLILNGAKLHRLKRSTVARYRRWAVFADTAKPLRKVAQGAVTRLCFDIR
jgi:hypothetical protein